MSGSEILDHLRVDYPDADVEKSLELVAGQHQDDAMAIGELDADPLILESWDHHLATFLKRSSGNGILPIEISRPELVAPLFHAAVTWLGVRKIPLQTVQICLAEDVAGDSEFAEAFAREKERHLNLHELDLPEFDVLRPEHQYRYLAGPSWDFATAPDRPTDLSDRQVFAIRLYTTEFYQAYHAALRSGRGDDATYRQLLPLIACMDAGMENLPPVPGLTFRGERNDTSRTDARRALEPGDSFAELSYLSSSVEEWRVLLLRSGFLFRIEGETGRDISPLSPYPEEEICFGRGLVQRVTGKDASDERKSIEVDFRTAEANPGWRSMA